MTRYVLDTDTFSLYLQGDPTVTTAIVRHLSDDLAVSIITVEELWDGWQAAVRKARTPEQIGRAYDRLTTTIRELNSWPIYPFPEAAVHRQADLKKQKLNVGSNDLKIAAIALEMNAKVVTRNRQDFSRVPGLAIENWA